VENFPSRRRVIKVINPNCFVINPKFVGVYNKIQTNKPASPGYPLSDFDEKDSVKQNKQRKGMENEQKGRKSTYFLVFNPR